MGVQVGPISSLLKCVDIGVCDGKPPLIHYVPEFGVLFSRPCGRSFLLVIALTLSSRSCIGSIVMVTIILMDLEVPCHLHPKLAPISFLFRKADKKNQTRFGTAGKGMSSVNNDNPELLFRG